MFEGYELIDIVGRTAGSELWRGRRFEDGAPVLLKVLPKEAPPVQSARFRREYDLLRSLDIPGVPQPIALIEQAGSVAIVLEDVGGESLETVLGRRRLDLPDALAIATRLAGILAGVHAAPIVHRDLRPANLLIAPGCRPFLVDFHFAARGEEEIPAPGLGPPPGDFDPAYLSPEQTGLLNRAVDYRTDFYSFGVVLYRLLTGRLPFAAADRLESIYCQVARRPKAAEVPPPLSDLLLKLLAKEADDRYRSAHGLRADLEECLAQLNSTGRIVPFALGAGEVADRFLIPQRLYGRDAVLATLVAAFERVAESGWPELVIVSGPSGVGKSSLANELRRPVVRRRGYFVDGKFDPFQRDIPYAALARACRILVRQILAEKEEEIALRKGRLRDALGVDGRLLVDFVPELARIVGPQPTVAELPPAEAQNRFHALFQRFVGALATPEHPLLLFLDDLQWLDEGSLKLIESLAVHPDTRNLVLIGAYRDDEVSPSHPLLPALERIAKVGVKTLEMALAPLSPEALQQLISDTVHGDPERSAPLARSIFAKTQGNPFFTIQLLNWLHKEKLLTFDPQRRGWTWDLASIEAKGFTDNVVELMIGKLKRFGDQTVEALRLAGRLGNTFELETLAAIWGRAEEETAQALEEAVRERVVVRRHRTYSFLHDRLHQAACELIPGKERAEVHLKIGRLLLAHLPPDAVEERLFEVVTQLNLGAPGITAEEEKTRIAELNLRAARRAKTGTAYQSAVRYLAAGARLLGCDAWERHDPLAFALFLERAEGEFLCGNFARAEHLFPSLLHHARTRLEQAAVYRIKIDTLTTEGKDEQAIECALECLRIFGLDLAPHPSAAEVEAAYGEVWKTLGTRAIDELIDLPPMTDPEMRAAMDILARLYAPAYHLDNNLFYLHLCQGVNVSLRHGNCPASTHAYGWFGVVLTCVFLRPDEGTRFARLAFDLMERHRFLAYKARAIFVLRIISYWTGPLDRMLEYSRAAFEAALETGDVPGACFSRNHTLMGMLLRGDPLSEVDREAQGALEYVRRAGFGDVHDMIVGIERLVQAMRGNTRHLATYDDGRFSEAGFEAKLADGRMPTLLFYYHVLKLMARFLAGDYQAARAAGEKSRALLWAGLFSAHGHCFHFYHALTLAAVIDDLTPAEREEALAALAGHREFLHRAAHDYPPTFQHADVLVAAEIARIEGRELEAERLYEEAIRAAREHGFVQDEGTANELAGRFHQARGFETIAGAYFRHARTCYARWGAEGKVRQLEARYPRFLAEPVSTPVTLDSERLLDTLAVVKASQAISGQIRLDRLLDTVMRHVMASGGARKGGLLLLRPQGLVLVAEAHMEGDQVQVRLYEEKRDFEALLPASLLNSVRCGREKVVLTEAAPNPFAADDYFSRHRPKSALCLPIVCRAEPIGLLYLENDRIPDVFTPERLALLEFLTSQAAIFLENALLYDHLRQENVERRRADRALRESESRFGIGFTHAVIGMALLTAEGRFTQVNRSLCEMLGYSEAEMLARHFTDITDPEDVASSIDQVRRLLAGEADSFQTTKRYRHKGGQAIWAEMSVAPIRAGEGEPASFVVQIQDITERRRAEEALRQQEERFRYVALATRDAIYDWDVRTGRVWRNEAYQEHYPQEEQAGTGLDRWEGHLHPDDRTPIVESLRAAFRHRQSFWSDEYRFRRSDGSVASVVDRGYILYSDEGEPVRMIGAMTDITDRRKALLEAEAARDKIDAILKSMADGLLVTDLADRVVLMNEAAEALLGIGHAGTSWRHIDTVVAEETLRRQIGDIRRGKQERGTSEWERPEAGAGQARVLQSQTTAVRSVEGRRTGTITLLRDITREREIDRMKNEFISTAAHELRTPLTTVMGYLELLQDEERFPPEERKAFLSLVYEKSEVLDRIIGDLLDLSRVQAGKLVTLDKVREALVPLVAHAVAAYRGIASRHAFELRFPDGPVELCIDPGKIGQVLDNLFSNAVKFSPAGGRIQVTGRRTDGEFEMTVADEGIGMRPEQVARIFDKFYRADASNTAVSGLGLGMSIVKNIVEAHGGRIWVESQVGQGTKVHFTLPLEDRAGECAHPLH